jgi:hypothetical protein
VGARQVVTGSCQHLWATLLVGLRRYGAIIAAPWTGKLDEFISRFTYDIEQILPDHLENLKDDLRSGAERASVAARKESEEIMGWLLPPQAALSDEERLRRVALAINDPTLTIAGTARLWHGLAAYDRNWYLYPVPTRVGCIGRVHCPAHSEG